MFCVLRVASYVLRLACCMLRVTCCVLRVACYVLRVTCYVLRCEGMHITRGLGSEFYGGTLEVIL